MVIRLDRMPPVTAKETGRNIPAVLFVAWKRVTSRRLPRELLYNQVYKTAAAMQKTVNQEKERPPLVPVPKNFGRCHTLQITPRIKLAVNALFLACSLGRM